LKNGIFFLFLTLILFNCGNNVRNGYISLSQKNIYDIDFDNYYYEESVEGLNLPFEYFPVSLNPFRAISDSEIFLKKALFSSLFYIDPKSKIPEKNLTKDYRVSSDGLKYSFKIRENVYFTDGKPLESKDVVASLSLVNGILKESVYFRSICLNNESLVFNEVNNFEFEIILSKPNSNLLFGLSDFPILKEETIKNISKSAENFIELFKTGKTFPIGTGPYIIKSIKEEYVSLIRNPNYFKKSLKNKNLPYTEEIKMIFYKDSKAMVADFIEEKIDVVFPVGEERDDLYNNYYDKKSDVMFVNSGFDKNKTTLLYNSSSDRAIKDKKLRIFINNLITKTYKGKYYVSNRFFEAKNYTQNIENLYSQTPPMSLLCPEEDKDALNMAKSLADILISEKINVTVEAIPYYKYLERIFDKSDFDIALVKYNTASNIFDLYSMFNDERFSFLKFVENPENYNLLILSLLNEIDMKKRLEIIRNLDDLIEKEVFFGPFFLKRGQYAVNNVFNLKNLYDDYNLISIETIFKASKER